MEDVYRLRQMLADSGLSDERRRIERQRLEALLGYCEQSGCRRPALLGYFGETHDGDCGNCDNCIVPPRRVDATEPARMALSCVYRTGQRFGAGHLVDVLRGKDSERISSLGHARLSTFGIGAEQPASFWHSLIRQLLAAGMLAADPAGHGGLRLDPSARDLLRGNDTFRMRQDPARKPAGERRAGKKTTDKTIELSPSQQQGFDSLRALRLELARAEGVPPYVIFHDATLQAMLAEKPDSLDALAGVQGVGRHKLEKYGQVFLERLRELDGP
ncbi:MAG: RQC domain-containing protein, partial [Wenzhouxiangellaceae bacterium]